MASQTSIEWTDFNWNFLRGCSRVSEGCRNCYAEKIAGRFSGEGMPYEGLAKQVNKEARWTGEISFDESALLAPLKRRKPTKYFVNSMSDLFHEKVENEWLDKAFAVMALASHHTFQILTKRADRMKDYFSNLECRELRIREVLKSFGILEDSAWSLSLPREARIESLPLENVWLGVSVENQKAADERIPLLLETPAAIRWLSCEPLLEQVGITNYLTTRFESSGTHHETEKIDWVVVGGESGVKARTCDVHWISWIVHQCKMWNTPCFVKQLGANVTAMHSNGVNLTTLTLSDRKGGNISEFPEDLQIREFPIRQTI